MVINGVLRRLVQAELMSMEDATEADADAKKKKIPLFRYLVDNKMADPDVVANAASIEYGVPIIDVESIDHSAIPADVIDTKLLEKHQVLPLFQRGKKLFVGIADPTNARVLDEVRFNANLSVEPVLVRQDHLASAIEEVVREQDSVMDDLGDDGLENLDYDEGGVEEEEGEDDSSDTADSPVVKLVNKVLLDAIKRGASDIHFEPYEKIYRVRYRIDGMLKTVAKPPKSLANKIASRLKVVSKLDIAEKRIPQDGRVQMKLGKGSFDFRLSTCPTLFGEKVVMRLLDASAAQMGIEMLGYEDHQKELFLEAIHKPYGMVLVTGPTGSGKTVSLYTALNILNTDDRNISTAEDPVEIRVAGINQVQQNAKQGCAKKI